MHPINRPEVMVSLAAESFDENGKLISEQTTKLVKQLLEALVAWTNKLKCSSQQ
jgi:chromate reductase, NAD(P)H dehydrogenase (quinone)